MTVVTDGNAIGAELAAVEGRYEAVRNGFGNVEAILARHGAEDDVPRLVAAVRGVLDKHQPEQLYKLATAVCRACTDEHDDGLFAVWPCPTFLAVSRALLGDDGGQWIVHHRDGWCALPAGAEPDPDACNDPTLCGHVVVLRGGSKRGRPDCPECVALLGDDGA